MYGEEHTQADEAGEAIETTILVAVNAVLLKNAKIDAA